MQSMRNETRSSNAAENYTRSVTKKEDSYDVVTEHNRDLW